MTGYGKAEAELSSKKITVEIRSLNSKQLDLSVKMPSAYRLLEYEIRNRAAKTMQRGKVDIYITVESTSAAAAANIDKKLFTAYYDTLSGLTDGMKGESDGMNAALMMSILRLPEVVTAENTEISGEEQAAMLDTVDRALEHIDTFRVQEGRVLIEDLLRRVGRIERYKAEVEPFEGRRVEIIKERIRENISSLNIPLDSNRLEQEMIFYVEKLDITEEKVRLDNHCHYFGEVACEEDNAGRKLGFIAQEIGREINTMGSKANDSDIQRIVVQMKDELEKIKEQVLNIL